MFNRLKAHLFSGGAAGPASSGASASAGTTSTTSATPPSTTRPRYIPNLYPVGDTTIETYFRRLLSGPDTAESTSLSDLVREDVVAAAIHVARTDPSGRCVVPPADKFLPVLTRCITTVDFETAQFADEYMAEPEEAGISALQSPLLLQILVAVALKHRHKEMLRDLLKKHGENRPPSTIFEDAGCDAFRGSPFGSGVLDDPNYGKQAWLLLSDAGWAPPLTEEFDRPSLAINGIAADSDTARHTLTKMAEMSSADPAGALLHLDMLVASGLDPQPFTGYILDALVKDGTPAMVAHFLGVVTRKTYDGIPPRPKWPGMQSLLTKAAARPPNVEEEVLASDGEDPDVVDEGNAAANVSEDQKDKRNPRKERRRQRKRAERAQQGQNSEKNNGYGVLRVLVDIGGMDIHTSPGIWYKQGPDDEHPMALSRSTELPDGSFI
ncbi:hypothetical protein Sste5346_006403 [Sporothrix stenoceras]|uniref:Uncharacterized protein n=1 Tax=Sporothrix stenoceras TaxID=5173 RepID=A0ABR3Z068_9PEZI